MEVCVWMSEVIFGGIPWSLSTLFEEPGGLIWLYLTYELQGSTHLCPSKVTFHYTRLFTWTQGFRTQVVMFVR